MHRRLEQGKSTLADPEAFFAVVEPLNVRSGDDLVEGVQPSTSWNGWAILSRY
jgi:hypothetical protein